MRTKLFNGYLDTFSVSALQGSWSIVSGVKRHADARGTRATKVTIMLEVVIMIPLKDFSQEMKDTP